MAWFVSAPMIANRHVEQRDREVRGKDRYPWLREEVSSPAAEVLPVRDCYEALIFKRKRGLPCAGSIMYAQSLAWCIAWSTSLHHQLHTRYRPKVSRRYEGMRKVCRRT